MSHPPEARLPQTGALAVRAAAVALVVALLGSLVRMAAVVVRLSISK
jgi:hypothetical protein